MSLKTSKIFTILKMKCPRCHEGDLFPPKTLFNPTKFSDMNKSCPECGQDFEPGLGFYYGAMYASFGLNTLIFIAVWIGMALVLDEIMIGTMVIVLTIVSIVLLPLNFRLSRAMWINIFVGYEGPAAQIPRIHYKAKAAPANPVLTAASKAAPRTV